MKRKILAALAVAAAMGPSMGGVEVMPRGDLGPSLGGWSRKGRGRSERQRRDPGPLQRRSFAEIPCEAPVGFFWMKDADSAYRLYRKAPAEGRMIYDQIHDRTIIESGWGYVKPIYHHGDLRRGR